MEYMRLHLALYPQSWGLTRGACRCRSISVTSLGVSSKKQRGQNVPLMMRINVPLGNTMLSTIYIHCLQTAVGCPASMPSGILIFLQMALIPEQLVGSDAGASWPSPGDKSARPGSLLAHLTTLPHSKLSFWATSLRNYSQCFQSVQLRKTDANGMDISQLRRPIDIIWLLYQYQSDLERSWGIAVIQHRTLLWLSVCDSDFFK